MKVSGPYSRTTPALLLSLPVKRLSVVVQLPSCTQLFATPWTAAHHASLCLTISQCSPQFLPIEPVIPCNHLILCHPLLLLPSISPSIRVFSKSWLFAWGGQSIGASASASVLPMSIQGWFPLGLTGLISLLSKGQSGVFSSTTQFESLCLLYGPTLTSTQSGGGITQKQVSHLGGTELCSLASVLSHTDLHTLHDLFHPRTSFMLFPLLLSLLILTSELLHDPQFHMHGQPFFWVPISGCPPAHPQYCPDHRPLLPPVELLSCTDFVFLGSKITADGDCSHEIKRRLLLGRKVMTNLDSILKSRHITLSTKVHLVKAMVFPVVMYGCESWTVKKAECQRIDAFERWCWRSLLRVPWTARRPNQSILKET